MNFADVLSDPLYVAFWVLSAGFVVRGLQERRLRDFFVAGLLWIVAYCTRVEALTLPLIVVTTLSIMALRSDWRAEWGVRRLAGAAGIFLLCVAAGIALFVLVYGYPSPKPVFRFFFSPACHCCGFRRS